MATFSLALPPHNTPRSLYAVGAKHALSPFSHSLFLPSFLPFGDVGGQQFHPRARPCTLYKDWLEEGVRPLPSHECASAHLWASYANPTRSHFPPEVAKVPASAHDITPKTGDCNLGPWHVFLWRTPQAT